MKTMIFGSLAEIPTNEYIRTYKTKRGNSVNFYAVPQPRFLITSTGDYLFLLFSGKGFSASDNQYITEKAYWCFSSVSEIEELENLISEETLKKFKENKEQKDNLFK